MREILWNVLWKKTKKPVRAHPDVLKADTVASVCGIIGKEAIFQPVFFQLRVKQAMTGALRRCLKTGV